MTDMQTGLEALARRPPLVSPDSDVDGLRPTQCHKDGGRCSLPSKPDWSGTACSQGGDKSADDAELEGELYKRMVAVENRTKNAGCSITQCQTSLKTTGSRAAELEAGEGEV